MKTFLRGLFGIIISVLTLPLIFILSIFAFIQILGGEDGLETWFYKYCNYIWHIN